MAETNEIGSDLGSDFGSDSRLSDSDIGNEFESL